MERDSLRNCFRSVPFKLDLSMALISFRRVTNAADFSAELVLAAGRVLVSAIVAAFDCVGKKVSSNTALNMHTINFFIGYNLMINRIVRYKGLAV